MCVTTLEGGNTRTVRQIAWSPCGTRIATASFDRLGNLLAPYNYIADWYSLMSLLDGVEINKIWSNFEILTFLGNKPGILFAFVVFIVGIMNNDFK